MKKEVLYYTYGNKKVFYYLLNIIYRIISKNALKYQLYICSK